LVGNHNKRIPTIPQACHCPGRTRDELEVLRPAEVIHINVNRTVPI
jgi:hypothetical protein